MPLPWLRRRSNAPLCPNSLEMIELRRLALILELRRPLVRMRLQFPGPKSTRRRPAPCHRPIDYRERGQRPERAGEDQSIVYRVRPRCL